MLSSRINQVVITKPLFLEGGATEGYSSNVQSTPFPSSSQRIFVQRASEQAWKGLASSVDGTKLAAIVNNGSGNAAVYTSTDSGVSWTLQSVPGGSTNWLSIVSSEDGYKLALINGQYVYTSVDSGISWTQQSYVSSSSISDIASSTNGGILYIVDNTNILVSTNSGVSFTSHATTVNSLFGITCSYDGVRFAVIPTSGYIYTWGYNGNILTTQSGSGSRNWKCITCSSDGTKLAAGSLGDGLFLSFDSAVTWTYQAGIGVYDVVSVAMSADGTIIAAIAGSTGQYYIYISIDSGTSWIQQTAAGQRNWSSIRCSSDGLKIVASTFNGYIYTSVTSIPTVSTITTSAQGSTAARSGGIVRDDGGAEVTARGICWNTAGTPTITDSKTVDGSGTGALIGILTGLTANTTYYVRAYATNRVGTAYGQQVTFTTAAI